ncbi:MAG: hypothetical protein A3A97_00535 [Candidatus Terrybacteria bacterium RIFCSPLOWO2_01_FULL_40_23]|uniref:histidine kinase n=1 Tax=Candidatus Terrybacteria bacterium RIFCSPLOWO2_01_FULL_40_23 TaxID=1802366 RepID=A0A1G2PTL3_9BACT|nr:MAG: hypothetical protein A3A97_00535 [Candidatus Terrybacteria bacterium RIFCSPLOWO2_01_FULL_40_23]
MAALFSKAPNTISEGQFAKELLTFVAGLEEARKAFPRTKEEIISISTLERIYDKERAAAEMYRRAEKFLVANYPARYTIEKLRETVSRKLHPERICEGSALLFLNNDMRAISLFRLFVNSFAFRVGQSMGKEAFAAILRERFADQDLVNLYISKGYISWEDINLLLKDVPQGEKLVHIQDRFSRLISFLMNLSRERVQDARTQLLIEDVYKTLKREYIFLDDFPVVLSIFADQNILRDERVGMLSKTQLTERSRMQTRKVEETLVELEHEKDVLQDTLKQLETSQEKLKALDYAKSQFIEVVSHQFRTPLSTIRWTSEMLKDEFGKTIPDRGKGFLENISFKSRFLINILNDIFDVLQLEGGNLQLQRKPAQLWELIADQIEDMKDEAESHKASIVFDKSGDPLKEVLVDHQMIRRVLEILIRNAINYGPAESGQVTVKMGIENKEDKNYVWVEIADKGIGIIPEDLPKIFTKFFRAQNAVHKVADGAGLGLYLVRSIIELHGGHVAVYSKPDQGSSFRFYIPIAA